ncbi:MAG: SDR family oxidoreductase [Myxococcales bacterium]|nr:SDR family oxidoreductase [Myxococcales bacterium]
MSDSRHVILVTGASRGIGLAIVKRFARLGWRVAACARSPEVEESGADVALRCDVSDPQQVARTVAATHERLGRIDALVNNAGLSGSNSLSPDAAPELSDLLWHQILATNLHGTYYFAKHVLPILPDGSGRIVNIASVLALFGVPDATAYCAAKHAVLGFTRALSKYAAPRGITVNAICPGWTRTQMAEERMAALGLSQEQLQAGIPLGQMVEPEEVAALVELLVISEAGRKISGQALTIDGGSFC